MKSNSREWLQNLKVGDIVIVNYRHAGTDDRKTIQQVTHVTATQIHAGQNYKFKRSTGQLMAQERFNFTEILEATPEAVAAVRETHFRNLFVNKIRNSINWQSVTTDQMKRMEAILVEPRDPATPMP